MQLPDKVQAAIHTLGQYEITPGSVAPFWFRQYLRLKPDTPPPIWGATKGYWGFFLCSIKRLQMVLRNYLR